MLKQIGITSIALISALAVGCSSGGKHDHDHDHENGHGHHDHEDETKSVQIAKADVPETVMAGFRKAFPDGTIQKIEKETYKDGTVHYEFEFKTKNGEERETEFDVNGNELDGH